jgi:hypothetical protein
MPPEWLDLGDKVASVVGAAAGVTALLVQILTVSHVAEGRGLSTGPGLQLTS